MGKSYHVELIEALRDPQEAAEYLDAAFEDDDPEAFQMALKQVAEAQAVTSQLIEKVKFSQDETNHKVSRLPNSDLYQINSFLHTLGFRLAVQRC
ncbi:MAG: transcriptional regulator [Gammaproteobacteria bacterium]|nr:MAG: transcriptional regulator [Gammaproteobacteria bacterium]RKZ42055.1 MAG: transcriptional regulator [Gammaproteobacteria bacterium]RKZ71426.1 MAG: transcriptional regulator [Gammaproteobacteria bacterium]